MLVAANLEGAALSLVDASPSITCCDFYGNAGGDWPGALAALLGTYGNVSSDPRFCDPPSGHFGLGPDSPCLPEGNTCGVQIGALGQTCDASFESLVDRTGWGRLKSRFRQR